MTKYISYELLAAMISRQFAVTVQVNGNDAWTRWINNEYVINLPTLSAATYEPIILGYTWHEIAHVRHTDFAALSGQHPDVWKALENIFEDVYIERTIVKDYPGMLRDLKAVSDYVFKDPEPHPNFVTAILQYILLSARGITYDSSAIPDGYKQQLDPIIQKAGLTTSTQDCMRLADEALCILNDLYDDADSAEPCDADDQSDQSGQGMTFSMDQSDQSDQSGDGQDLQILDTTDFVLSAEDMKNLSVSEAVERKLGRDEDAGTQCYDPAKANVHESAEAVQGFLINMPARYARVANMVASVLTNRLLSLVQSYKMGYLGSQIKGRVDTRALYRLALNDNRVFRRRLVQPAINAHVSLLLDGSGSMEGVRAGKASMAGYALLKALRQIQGVTADEWVFFDTNVYPMCSRDQLIANSKTFIDVCRGCTPMGAAYASLLKTLPTNDPLCRRIVICITDGEIDDPLAFAGGLTTADKFGIVTYGIGIVTEPPHSIPKERRIVIDNVDELVYKLFDIARGIICP